MKRFYFLILLTGLITFGTACDDDNPFQVDYSTVPEPFELEGAERTVNEDGLVIYFIEEGVGPFAVDRRDAVSVFYTGRKLSNFEVFDSSYRNGRTSPFTVTNLGNLIEGFKDGLIGMKPGEKRVLIIPPNLGYGDSETSDLRNDTLRFDIELEEILDF